MTLTWSQILTISLALRLLRYSRLTAKQGLLLPRCCSISECYVFHVNLFIRQGSKQYCMDKPAQQVSKPIQYKYKSELLDSSYDWSLQCRKCSVGTPNCNQVFENFILPKKIYNCSFNLSPKHLPLYTKKGIAWHSLAVIRLIYITKLIQISCHCNPRF